MHTPTSDSLAVGTQVSNNNKRAFSGYAPHFSHPFVETALKSIFIVSQSTQQIRAAVPSGSRPDGVFIDCTVFIPLLFFKFCTYLQVFSGISLQIS